MTHVFVHSRYNNINMNGYRNESIGNQDIKGKNMAFFEKLKIKKNYL